MSISFGTGLTTILGPNGAGKTTLLKTLATVIPPFQGHIEIDGIRVENEADALKVRHKIGYLPQNFGFDPAMTVENFVTYGAWVRGTDKNQRKNQVIDAISKVDLHEQRNIKMQKLSGGMQRRAGIAWAIVGNPKLVILDEPTVGLDPEQKIQFRKIIRSEIEATVLISTHHTDDIETLADNVIVFSEGQCKFYDQPEKLAAVGNQTNTEMTRIEQGYMSILNNEG